MAHPKTLHMASSFGGGAGTAARRIVEAQRSIGLDSDLVALTGGNLRQGVSEFSLSTGLPQRLKSKALTVLQSHMIQNSDNLMTPLSLSATSRIKELLGDYDILNVHATYNVLNSLGIRTLSARLPIVVTLHDQRFFTGGCHYSWNCRGYINECTKCPQTRKPFQFLPKNELKKIENHLRDIRNISFVSPSKWLADLASVSRVLRNAKISIIPNPIPETKCVGQTDSVNGSSGVFRVGFIAKNLYNPFKGLDTLIKAIEIVASVRPVRLLLFGSGPIPKTSGRFEVVQSEFGNDDQRVKAINSCDVVVVPSKQDNYPSVIGECLVEGVPVIATNVGGIREIVDEFRLPVFEPGDWQELSRLLAKYPLNRLTSTEIESAKRKYSFAECGTRYLEKYKSSLDVN